MLISFCAQLKNYTCIGKEHSIQGEIGTIPQSGTHWGRPCNVSLTNKGELLYYLVRLWNEISGLMSGKRSVAWIVSGDYFETAVAGNVFLFIKEIKQ